MFESYTCPTSRQKPARRKKTADSPRAKADNAKARSRESPVQGRDLPSQECHDERWHRRARRALDDAGYFKQSFNMEFCVCRGGLYRCNQHLLCGHCRFAEAAKQAKDYAARVVLAREGNPRLTLLAAVFSVGERDSYALQAEELMTALRRVRRSKGAWSKVRGLIWHIEPALSASGRWFAHLHCILAIDVDDQPRHQIQLATAFARTVHRMHFHQEPLAKGSSTARLDAHLRLQRVQPVWAFDGDRFARRMSADAPIEEIAHHVARLVCYARKSGGLPEESGHRDLRPAHLVEVMQHKGRKAGTAGCFRGIPKDDLLAVRHRLFPTGRIPTRPPAVTSMNAPKVTSPLAPCNQRRRKSRRPNSRSSAAPASTKRPAGREVVPKGPRHASKHDTSSRRTHLVLKPPR